MKKKLALIIVVMLITMSLFTTIASAAPKEDCNSVTSGGVFYSAGHYLAGQEVSPGYDIFGYNYQAHYFKGSYANAYLGRVGLPPYTGDDAAYLAANPTAASHWAWPYREYMVEMKWNDAWLSNQDRDGDGALDRHYGFDSYIGSGAWEYYRDYLLDDQGAVIYESSSKIIAVPADAYKVSGVWYAADGTEIGPDIWGAFAIIQETLDGDVIYSSPLRPGFGNW